MYKFVFSLFFGLPLFVLAPVADAASAKDDESPSEKYQHAAEQCITRTEQELEEKGIVPSEESSEYDVKFDEAYKECMQAKGMPDDPAPGEESVPSGSTTE